MSSPRTRAYLAVCVGLLLAGCADKTVRLTYTAPAPSRSLAPRLIIGPFRDIRGNEGDTGDPYRVGGIYGGYGNRLAKVMVASLCHWLLGRLVSEDGKLCHGDGPTDGAPAAGGG